MTVATEIEKVRRRLLGARKSEVNYLMADVAIGATTITLEDTTVGTGLTRGVYLGVGLELMLVRSVAGQVATVRRGYLGTTAAAHLAGATVEIAPRFPRADILDSLKDEIISWGPDLFYVPAPLAVTGSTSVRGYNLNLGTFYDVLQVRRSPSTGDTSGSWPKVNTAWHVDRSADTASFPSGVALHLGAYVCSNLKVVYSKPFVVSTFTEATDLVATCKLDESYLDILRYGAMWRLMSGTEATRTDTFAQGEPRSAEEVPPGHRINTASGFKKLRDQRMAEEKMRLARRWSL